VALERSERVSEAGTPWVTSEQHADATSSPRWLSPGARRPPSKLRPSPTFGPGTWYVPPGTCSLIR